MRRKLTAAAGWTIVVISTLFLTAAAADDVSTSHVYPKVGSLYGGMALTIYGQGFAKNQFNFGTGYEHLGNHVLLKSQTRSYECEIHKDGCTETQLMCFTKAMKADDYYVRVTVDGVAVPDGKHCASNSNNCKFRPSSSNTPHLSSVTPITVTPGSLITMSGKLVTDRLGSHQQSSSNGRVEQMLRVYMAGQKCELFEDFEESIPYGIALDSDTSLYGYMKCMMEGSYVSNVNGSFLVEAPYGRSYPDLSVLRLFADNSIAMLQTYARIDSVTPATGSLSGGTMLTIEGDNFDDTDKPLEVHTAGSVCEVQQLTKTEIVCKTAADPSTAAPYRGSRGLDHSMSATQAANLDDVTSVLSSQNDSSLIDTLSFSYNSSASTQSSGLLVVPRTGEYSFELQGMRCMARLYLSNSSDPSNKMEVVEKTFTSKSTHHHHLRYSLVAGTDYYMEVLHSSTSGSDNSLSVSLRMYQTDKTATQTGSAVNEKQKLTMSSVVVPETQDISFTNWVAQQSVNEVQTISIVPTTPGYVSELRLGMNAVFTGKLTTESSADTVQAALNSLTSISPDTVSVQRSTLASGGYMYTVTFNSERGEWTPFTYKTYETAAVGIQIARVTAGVPSHAKAVLEMDGRQTKPVSITADTAKMTSVIEELFSVRCPGSISGMSGAATAEDFESLSTGWSSVHGGKVVINQYPLCGSKSLQNPSYIVNDQTQSIFISSNHYVCFGYMGFLTNRMTFNFSFIDGVEHVKKQSFGVQFEPYDGRWHYQCVDVFTILTDAYPDGKYFKVNQVQVSRDGSRDTLIDNVYFGSQSVDEPEIHEMRQMPPRDYLMNSVVVTSSLSMKYKVQMYPVNCSSPFSLMTAANGPSDITRDEPASPPITGSFDISYNNRWVRDVPADVTQENLQALLETLPGIGGVGVERSGLCHSYEWEVDWLQVGGDRPSLVLDTSNIQGVQADIVQSTTTDGYAVFSPLIGDMLFQSRDVPPVTVNVNGIPSVCVGSCDFIWSLSATPSVTSVTPTSGGADVTLTIQGTGLDANAQVYVGKDECTNINVAANEMTCDVTVSKRGTHQMQVYILGQGQAEGSLTYEFVSVVADVSPTSGHLSGGYSVTLTGSGLDEDMTIQHAGGMCYVVAGNTTHVVCTMQPTANSGAVDFLLEFGDGTNMTTSGSFTFLNAVDSSVVTAVSTSTSSVLGGVEVTITGTGFGSSASQVFIGFDHPANVSSWSDTEIVVLLPPLPLGSYPLLVVTATGYADLSTHSIADMVYELEVTDIQPRITSKYGASRHTITGIGFGTRPEELEVKIGSLDCEVDTVTDTSIECVTGTSSQHHSIDNMGTHPQYGIYYAWNPPSIDVQVGDVVDWSWSSPTGISDVMYTVQQTDDISASSPTVNGFGSVLAPSGYGSYSYQFTEEGVFYYWSAPVDPSGSHIMRGKVEVGPKDPVSADVQLSLGGYEAQLNIPARRKRESREKRAACVAEEPSCLLATAGVINNCVDDDVVVNSISPNNGTSQEIITLTGRGFSLSSCNNIITFGDTKCTVLSSTATEVQCQLSLESEVEPGVVLLASVIVNNLGTALLNLTGEWNKGYTLSPRISGMSHHTGSLGGGQLLTITGEGFLGNGRTQVAIGFEQCAITSLNYTVITCLTAEAGDWTGDITVSVMPSTNQVLTAECDADCSYSYGSQSTPSLLTVSPINVTAATNLAITGSLFGIEAANVEVYVGDSPCTIATVTDTQIECAVDALPAGKQTVSVRVSEHGDAVYSPGAAGQLALYVDSLPIASSVSPSSGSVHGGLLVTVAGNGFHGDTSVAVDGSDCEVVTVNADAVTCLTPAHGEGDVQVVVTSNGIDFPGVSLSYSLSDTPTITDVTPATGYTGDVITITGTLLDPVSEVSLGDSVCAVQSSTSTEITCTLGQHAAGSVYLVVTVADKGKTATNSFTFELSANSVSPTTGSFGGGQAITVDGAGLDDTVTVTVCGELCVNTAVTTSQVSCSTPPQAASATNVVCDVVLSLATESATLSSAYTYDVTLGGQVTNISPTRGGTGGGTDLTISGSGLNHANVEVSIDGVDCAIVTKTDTEIVCNTGAHSVSGIFDVNVILGNDGLAVVQGSVEFYYIDVWSSLFTWGGGPLPAAGEIVVVKAGQTLLLDQDTPILKVLLIQGGKLVFDEKDVELNAENILITDGGALEVGTEDAPFQHNATITLHGHLRSLEMPIYGAKTLALRNGTLDLHGKPKVSWTVLQSSVSAGDTEIVLQKAVDWEAGDHIVIASTGKRHSQNENEKREITAVSNDGLTITLNESLTYGHLGETADIGGGHMLEMRAEVGLLTHNVLVRGSINHQWDEKIEACEKGFDTGQFATQTCFQGRFGEEMGSDEFGAAIMMHAPEPDKQWAVGRLSHIEVTHAGQAFRLGRYPIHFHLNGNQSMSYVKGCSIHKTFNRAINIHNTHNVLLDNNVIYHIKGGAVFLEDSIETGNIIQYNLAVFVISSTSLLNDDVTPAAFWLTHPTNIVRHNHVAGGSHFAYWYRMHTHPTGPSADSTLCPKNAPLGEFRNNTAHSLGWFGLWTFEDYYPMDGDGICSQRTKNIPAVFETLTAWHCEKGAEFVNGGDLQFDGFIMANNEKAGFEGKINRDHTEYSMDGPILKNSIIAAQTGTGGCTQRGIILPFSSGFMIYNTEFVGFNISNCAAVGVTTIDGKCTHGCGGYTYKFSQITRTDSPQMGAYRWEHEAAYHDLDGSLTGIVDAKIVATNPSLDPAVCTAAAEWSIGSTAASLCDTPYPFHRYSWNNAQPYSLNFKFVLLSTEHGTSRVPWLRKRLTHKEGWMVQVMGHTTYNLTYENGGHFTNTSNTGVFYMFNDTDYVIMGQKLSQRPDRFQVAGGPMANGSETELTFADNVHGDWHLDGSNMFTYMVSGKTSVTKRSVGYGSDKSINFRVYTCFFDDCIPPPDPNQVPPPTKRPDDAVFWSDDDTWKTAEPGMGGNNGDGTFSAPKDNTDVKIFNDDWVVLDTQPSALNKLYIYGVLEFEPAMINGAYMDFQLSATHILLFGGRLFVGWEDNPMRGNVEIILRGDWSTPEQFMPNGGPTVGAKAIGVFGSLDIHGVNRSVHWTKLSQEASLGSSDITLVDMVDWVVGDEIVITTTGKSAWESEVRKITAVSGDMRTLTLNDSLSYKHTAIHHNLGGYTLSMTAEVGLLTRNVKVRGEAHSDLQKQSFGGRILVSDYFDGSQQWTGYARISNTEFFHMGQEGYINYEDPRFALAFLNTGPVSDIKPSYIKQNSFKDTFNTAIGVIDADGIVVEDNVVHGTVDAGIRVKSTNSTLDHNLISFTQTRACYQEREETDNYFFHGSIEIFDATGVTMTDNAVAGSERSGYSISGYACGLDDKWSGNVAHGVLSGIVILPEHPAPTPCVKVSGITVYHSVDFGVYTQTSASVELKDLMLADNNVGVMSLIMGPGALSHQMGNKHTRISNSLIVGSTSERDCDLDYSADPDSCNLDATSQARSWNSPSGGSVGMAFGQFMSSTNNAPFKPWKGLMSYNSNDGLTLVQNVTFANFGVKCSGKRDYMMSTSPGNEDLQHPMHVSSLTLIDVEEGSKVFYHRPNVGKINSADCVDMDCDAKKKCMINDLDGTLLGAVGAVIPQSEFEWDGDPRRGLGDYRIPKTLLTDLEGNRKDINDVAPNKGIIGNKDCEYVEEWTAYRCTNSNNYKMLVIESMDPDTETRRLSPVAVLGDKYIDLINGPQDHGWCSGYTCRKRVSTFMALVATGVHYQLYFTSTSPQHLRLSMLQSAPDEIITLEIYYTISNRIDVYVDGDYVPPLNAAIVDGELEYKSPKFYCEFCPQNSQSVVHGDNFQNRWEQLMYVAVSGSSSVDIKMTNMIMLTFDLVMTEDQFFGEQLANNLAIFFDVDPSKIRVVNVISEDSQLSEKRRRKRALQPGHITVELEIGDSPTIGINDTITSNLTTQQLLDLRAELIDAVQTGSLSSQIGLSFSRVYITIPLPDASDPEWQNVAGSAGDYAEEVRLPSKLGVLDHPISVTESTPFPTISVQLLNDEDELVTQFGSLDWKVGVRLVSNGNANAAFTGTSEVVLVGGWANFTDFSISHPGSGFELEYSISSPSTVSYVSSVKKTFEVTKRQLDVIVAAPSTVTANETVDIELTLVDEGTTTPVSSWNGLGFRAFVGLNPIIDYNDGEITTTDSHIFDTVNGTVTVPVMFSHRNGYVLDIEIASFPDTRYSQTFVSDMIIVFPADYVAPYPTVSKEVTLRFEGTLTQAAHEVYFETALFNELLHNYEGVVIDQVDCDEELRCAFRMSGDKDVVDERLLAMWEAVKSSMEVAVNGETYSAAQEMTVNGENYQGADEPPPAEAEDDMLVIYIIAGATGAVVLIIIIVTAIILFRMSNRNSKVSHTPRSMSPDMGEDHLAYVGSPPISSKMPPIDPRGEELERVNERLKDRYVTETSLPPVSPRKIEVKPLSNDRHDNQPRWRF